MAKKVKKTIAPTISQSKVPSDDSDFLNGLKSRIQTAQLKAVASVNLELTSLYWDIGQSLLKKTRGEGWGAKVVERLATDLINAFPGVAGFSKRNLELMRQFAESYPVGVSSNKVNLMEKLPKELKGKLPSIEEIEKELSSDIKSGMVKSRKSIKPDSKSVSKKKKN